MELTTELRRRVITDPKFRAALVEDPAEVLSAALDRDLKGRRIRVHENSEKRVHFVLPESMDALEGNSADVRRIVGRALEDRRYRRALIEEPWRIISEEIEIELPDLEIIIHEDGERDINIVLPPSANLEGVEMTDDFLPGMSTGSWGCEVTNEQNPCTNQSGDSFCTATRGCHSLGDYCPPEETLGPDGDGAGRERL